MLQEVNLKGLEVRSIEEVQFHPFMVVFAKKDKEGIFYTKALEVTTVNNFKELTAFSTIIKTQIVENELIKDINSGLDCLGYSCTITDKETGKAITTKDKGFKGMRSVLAKWLNSVVICITDKNGKPNNVIMCKGDMKFKDTFLNVSNSYGLFVSYSLVLQKKETIESFNKKVRLVAEKALKQMNYFTNVAEKMSLFDQLAEKEEEAKAANKAKAKAAKEANKAIEEAKAAAKQQPAKIA